MSKFISLFKRKKYSFAESKVPQEVFKHRLLIAKWGVLCHKIQKSANDLNKEKVTASRFRQDIRELLDEYCERKIN